MPTICCFVCQQRASLSIIMDIISLHCRHVVVHARADHNSIQLFSVATMTEWQKKHKKKGTGRRTPINNGWMGLCCHLVACGTHSRYLHVLCECASACVAYPVWAGTTIQLADKAHSMEFWRITTIRDCIFTVAVETGGEISKHAEEWRNRQGYKSLYYKYYKCMIMCLCHVCARFTGSETIVSCECMLTNEWTKTFTVSEINYAHRFFPIITFLSSFCVAGPHVYCRYIYYI